MENKKGNTQTYEQFRFPTKKTATAFVPKMPLPAQGKTNPST